MEKFEIGNAIKLKIVGFVSLMFIGYFCIGLSLAVLPVYIHKTLGFSEIISGVTISLQYLTTFFFRGYGGKIVDKQGPKLAVKLSMSAFILSGFLLFIAFGFSAQPGLSLAVLMVSRLTMGIGEGLIGASPINWALLVIGDKYTATAISYSGVASYGALAVGAPLGVLCCHYLNMESLAILTSLLGVIGLLYCLTKTNAKHSNQQDTSSQLPFFHVLKLVLPFGLCLGLSGIGFGGISNFITLYFDYFHWGNAVLCLTFFSIPFVFARVFLSKYIDIYGGLKVGIISVFTELIGLILLFFAPIPEIAILGSAIVGLGFSLVFPAFGVVAVKSAPASSSGTALGCYGLFIDVSLALTGPLAGTSIHLFGMPYLFAFCSVMVLVALILSLGFSKQQKSVTKAAFLKHNYKK